MNKSKRDERWIIYMANETFIFIKYVGHKTKGTTIDILLPPQGDVLYIPFIIDNKPVVIETIIRPKK